MSSAWIVKEREFQQLIKEDDTLRRNVNRPVRFVRKHHDQYVYLEDVALQIIYLHTKQESYTASGDLKVLISCQKSQFILFFISHLIMLKLTEAFFRTQSFISF